MFFVCVTVGLVLLASKYHENVFRKVKNLCSCITSNIQSIESDYNNNKQFNYEQHTLALDKVILADSIEKCDYAVQRIRCNLNEGVLGFDCEWVNEGPVSLLQLATYNGVCALFRLGKIGFVPPKLKELLANDCILKVGVAPYEDGRKLTNDYGCRVFGTVDLRSFADSMGLPNRKGLAALSIQYLGIELDKIVEVQCGDWEAEVLTERQIKYAAYDAIASVLVYQKMQENLRRKRSLWKNLIIFIKTSYWNKKKYNYFLHNIPQEIVDVKYRELPLKTNSISGNSNNSSNNNNNNNNTNLTNKNIPKKCVERQKVSTESPKICGIPTRKEPLYHNCYLQAPDGETLCTCDRKKAEWYISKGLGEKINEKPFTVRLTFEPSGRALGEVGQYYTQVKLNQCVVCGSHDKFIKKNVVPREYRKYFPLVMKAHQSHDVLLLCPSCHDISNRHDLELRRELANLCNAPLTRPLPKEKSEHLQKRRNYLMAVKALKRNTAIPPHRRKYLESYICEYNRDQLTSSSELSLYDKSTSTENNLTLISSPPPHGLQVVQYFTNEEGGLVSLERIWREHFLSAMKPKYLPALWSVSHNQERLEIRQVQNRIELNDAKVAGLTS